MASPGLSTSADKVSLIQLLDFANHAHRRYNPLSGVFILCSPHRSKRPWQGAREDGRSMIQLPSYDPRCYLCPGNIRASGESNPIYDLTFIFYNDYPAVKTDQPLHALNLEPESDNTGKKNRLLKYQGVRGKCFVICFSPSHNLTLPQMPLADIVRVIKVWQNLFKELHKQAMLSLVAFKYLQIFENKGKAMGCSNPHPHGQAWFLDFIPTEVTRELESMEKYYTQHQSHLLGDYVALEVAERERVVCENKSFLVVAPYWAMWPLETLLISKVHLTSLMDFTEVQVQDLAAIIRELTIKYDNLFATLFPYSMGIHQSPLVCSESDRSVSWFHMHFYPPLVRLASIRKFSAGFELLGEAQRDLTCEQAASQLRKVSGGVHYTEK